MKTQIFHKIKFTSKVIQGHIRLLLCTNNFNTFIYGLILTKICMSANIMTTPLFQIWPELLFYGEILWFFYLRLFDINTTLSYVLMNNFCPCFFYTHQIFNEFLTWEVRNRMVITTVIKVIYIFTRGWKHTKSLFLRFLKRLFLWLMCSTLKDSLNYYPKLSLNCKISFISPSFKKNMILSHIAKNLQALKFLKNCLYKKAPC